jgi:chaperonin GroES
VVAVGSGRLLDSGERAKPQVKKGDRVIFTAYGGTEVTVDGEEVLILNEEDILAVVGK